MLFRRKHQGKLTLLSGRVKSKPSSTFVIHATPLHGGLDDASTTSVNKKYAENLEMKSFGKGYKGNIILLWSKKEPIMFNSL